MIEKEEEAQSRAKGPSEGGKDQFFGRANVGHTHKHIDERHSRRCQTQSVGRSHRRLPHHRGGALSFPAATQRKSTGRRMHDQRNRQ